MSLHPSDDEWERWYWRDYDHALSLQEDGPECQGHESLNGAHMGQTAYCDGTCIDRAALAKAEAWKPADTGPRELQDWEGDLLATVEPPF
jgi:hypothetical protein